MSKPRVSSPTSAQRVSSAKNRHGRGGGARTILPDPRISPRFAGLVTFGRYPRFEDVSPENRPVDWAVFGVPFDGGVTYRPGARFGPRAIREESQYLKRYSLAHNVDVCERLSLCDAGDSPVAPYDCEANASRVYEFARGFEDRRARLLALGGDHSIAYACIRAAHERAGSPKGGLALLHFEGRRTSARGHPRAAWPSCTLIPTSTRSTRSGARSGGTRARSVARSRKESSTRAG